MEKLQKIRNKKVVSIDSILVFFMPISHRATNLNFYPIPPTSYILSAQTIRLYTQKMFLCDSHSHGNIGFLNKIMGLRIVMNWKEVNMVTISFGKEF